MGPFQDAICNEIVDKTTETYGQQRLWASLGWGFSALFVSYFIEENILFDYSASFSILVILFTLDLLVIKKLEIPQKPPKNIEDPFMKMGQILKDGKVKNFLVYCGIVGILFGSLSQVFILLEDLGHRSDCNGQQAMKVLQGFVLFTDTMVEIPVFFFSGKPLLFLKSSQNTNFSFFVSGRLINHFGTRKLQNFILFLFALRLFFYGLLISPWQVLIFEGLHGPIVGLFYPILTLTAFQVSPENLTTTTTAVAYLIEGLGEFF